MGASTSFYLLRFMSLVVTALSNSQQCGRSQPLLQTLYISYNSIATLDCITARPSSSYWTCKKFDFDGNVVKLDILPPTRQSRSAFTYAVSEAGVYELSQILPGSSNNCQCKFEVKVNISTYLQHSILADLDHRYGKLNTTSFDDAVDTYTTTHSNHNCSHTLCSSGECFTVNATWYKKDGASLDLRSEERALTTRALDSTTASAGDYVCLTKITLADGSSMTYVTAKRRILERSPALPVSPSPSPVQIFELQTWEVAIISANAVVLVALIGIVLVCSVSLAVCRRRSNYRHSRLQEEVEMEQQSYCDETPTQQESIFTEGITSLEIALSAIVFEELLHKGTFKVVHKALVGSTEVVVKRLRDQSSLLGLSELKNEEEMLKSIGVQAGGHPNIMSLQPMQVKDCPACLLLEYAPFGTLDKFLIAIKAGFVPEWYMISIHQSTEDSYSSHIARDLMNVAVQVAEAMKFLSLRGLVHKDLSTRNTFIYNDFVVKIGNFGQQHEGNYYLVTQRGHFLQDMAPECIWHKKYSIKSDVWSFGILLYKLVTLEAEPYPGVEPAYLHRQMEEGRRPLKLPCFSKRLFFLIQQCWYFTPAERTDFVALLNTLNNMRDFPSRHIILGSSEHTAAIGIPVHATSNQGGGRHPEQQRRGSPPSPSTERTAETTVVMLSDEEGDSMGTPTVTRLSDGDEESLGPPTVKKSRTTGPGTSSDTHLHEKEQASVKAPAQVTSSSGEEGGSISSQGDHAEQESPAEDTSGSEAETESQEGNKITYRQSQKRNQKEDFASSPMYVELISKLGSPGSAYP